MNTADRAELLAQITPTMHKSLMILHGAGRAVVRRHATLDFDEIPVRTASSLERRGWAKRVGGSDEKTTLLEITELGGKVARLLPRDADHTRVRFSPAQLEHVNRALRYLGEASIALKWAKLPLPDLARGAEAEWIISLLRGERATVEATDSITDGIAIFAGEQEPQ